MNPSAEQLSLFGPSAQNPYTVSQITRYIKELFDTDFQLQDVWLEGEVSNFSRSAAGHIYFTLKDAAASIQCVLWRSVVARQPSLPHDGDTVIAHGRITVYEVQGRYQFYVDALQPSGVGLLYLEFETLKARLAEEGLFAPERKRPLPPFPRCVGVVTSPTGAALRDILHVLGRRFPLTRVLLSPTLVQGEEAPLQIVAALRALQCQPEVDVIIVARGGGSLEELWPFNDERVARAIVASRVPVISGVGHETDFTIADFAADVRAPTPSAAAEVAVPDQGELRSVLFAQAHRLRHLMQNRIAHERRALEAHTRTLRRLSPQSQIYTLRQRVDELTRASITHMTHHLSLHRERLRARILQLQSMNPYAILSRGYAIVRQRESGRVVRSVIQARSGTQLDVRVSDGEFPAVVE
ncbi:MAG: exodeoxyribonuclease VII large subunit [Anaerolineae bacterium]|jgi:exodeoxyribonuclease VII large subunit|nr:exodeoxyribonuclease VII large subunit [Anaerolineae bacterium]MDH7474047.1 exodeoxyribonuclease VII large subunit [Anaerolineae bacterium]